MNKKDLAVVFPGQGSQEVGMLRSLSRNFRAIQKTFLEASEILGKDLWQLVQFGSSTELNSTRWVQVAVLTTNIALWRVLTENFFSFDQIRVVAGHSLGEYAALVAADIIDFSVALELVKERASIIEKTVEGIDCSSAVVIGMEKNSLATIIDYVKMDCETGYKKGEVEITIANSSNQLVIAGHKRMVEKVIEKIKSLGGTQRIHRLFLDIPVHSCLLTPALPLIEKIISSVDLRCPPRIDLVCNASAKSVQTREEIQEALVCQVSSFLDWPKVVEKLLSKGVTSIIESGWKAILSNLIRKETGNALTCLSLGREADYPKLNLLVRQRRER